MQASSMIGTAGLVFDKGWSSVINDNSSNSQGRDCRGLLIKTAMIIGQYLSPNRTESSNGNGENKGKRPLTNGVPDLKVCLPRSY